MNKKVGVWLIGVNGGLATTLIFGVRAIVRKLTPAIGMMTEGEPFRKLELLPTEDIVFGGHDIRKTSLFGSAYDIYKETGTLDYEWLLELKDELTEIDDNVRIGTVFNCGPAIENFAVPEALGHEKSLRQWIGQIQQDILDFQKQHHLCRVIVVNIASTEPVLPLTDKHQTLKNFEQILDKNDILQIRASTLYCYAAMSLGFPYINFTPSNAALIPAIEELALQRKVPFMGNDGKTGETLLKSAIAPLFKYRNLQVMSWQGYNMLGDRDGLVLSDEESQKSKINTKDGVVKDILGYPLHTNVRIDYVPSLNDWKTAWDFIHFKGFLGTKMSLQFTWQGCDSILAAPLIIDMVRLADFAQKEGEFGPMKHLACFFKDPKGAQTHDIHEQFHMLIDYFNDHVQRKSKIQ